MIAEKEREEIISSLRNVQDEQVWLEIRDILAVAEAHARGAAKPRAYPGFGGEAGRAVAENFEQQRGQAA